MPVGAIVGGALGLGSAIVGANSAKSASNQQAASQAAALAQQQKQYDTTRGDLAPYRDAGAAAFGQQAALASGSQGAINQVKNSPYYQSLYDNGQQAVLANASATGGLRGGNVQSSLANFGRDTLAQAIQQQIQNLNGISTLGENAATGGAQLGQQNANSQQQALTNQGQAQANGTLGQGAAIQNGFNQAGSLFGKYFGGGTGFSSGGGVNVGNIAAQNSAAFGSNGVIQGLPTLSGLLQGGGF